MAPRRRPGLLPDPSRLPHGRDPKLGRRRRLLRDLRDRRDLFATQPGIDDANVLTAVWRGALFGFVAYATYDLTNMATLRGWPTIVTIIDMAWGTFLSAAVAGIATFAVLQLT